MSIQLDPIVAAALAAELDQRLRDARVRGLLLDSDHREARLYTDGGVLLIRLDKGKAPLEILLLPASEPPDTARKIALKVSGVSAVEDERVLIVRMRRFRGRAGRFSLVIELRPSESNVAVLEGEEEIVRHLLVRRESRGRRWRTGYRYPFPKPSTRRGAYGPPTEAEWKDALQEGPDPRKALLRNLAFTSPINVRWILEGGPAEDVSARWQELLDSAGGPVFLLPLPEGVQPYPHRLGFDAPESEGLLAAFADRDQSALSGNVHRDMSDRLARVRTRARKRLKTLKRQLEDTPDEDSIRAHGDLLLARFHEIPSGADHVELIDFEGNPVRVPLDPALTAQENAAKCYTRAAKVARAKDRLPGLIEEAQTQGDHWDQLHQDLEKGDLTPETLEDALPDPRTTRSSVGEPTYPFRSFQSSGGLEIRVGKGAKKNDELTFHFARPDDVWLHARHSAGAHVVLRWTHSDAPPARDLEEAAVLAALHSKARTSGSVPVDWTRRKHVRKPRGARAGSVVLEREQTVFVEPDPSLVDRLAIREDG